jgi:hypothetical protein
VTREEQEFVVVDNRGDNRLLVSSTHPVWTRKLERLEARGLAVRTRTITAVENGERSALGGEWAIEGPCWRCGSPLAARPARRRRLPPPAPGMPVFVPKALRPQRFPDDNESGRALPTRSSCLTRRREPLKES